MGALFDHNLSMYDRAEDRLVWTCTGTITTVAGGDRGLQDGPTESAKFSWPYGGALSPDATTLYVADSGNDCVRAVSLTSGKSSVSYVIKSCHVTFGCCYVSTPFLTCEPSDCQSRAGTVSTIAGGGAGSR
eukprot:5719488-Pyramimonas_sp.AAC.1